MSSSGIIISYEAAERDVRNLEQAKATLNDALAALNNLLATAECVQGMTGSAIVNKTKVLIDRLNKLNENFLCGALKFKILFFYFNSSFCNFVCCKSYW